MTQAVPLPTLAPQFCFSTVALQDFLRGSRFLDDRITQSLNALITPATAGFDPSSTASPRAPISRRINPASCLDFKTNVLFPSWQTRSVVLDYCASVATSPDPEDPELNIYETKKNERRENNRVDQVDERLDPYSARSFPGEARTERLAAVIRQERGVENIIRARTWGLVNERCGNDWRDWEASFNDWRKGREKR